MSLYRLYDLTSPAIVIATKVSVFNAADICAYHRFA